MTVYNRDAQKRFGENTEIYTILPEEVLNLASGANRDSEMVLNPKGYGSIVIVKLSAEAGTAGITPHVFVKDEAGNKLLIRSEAALTANGTYTYVYAPGAATGSWNGVDVVAAADVHLPREWGVRLNKSTGDTDQTFTAEILGMDLA